MHNNKREFAALVAAILDGTSETIDNGLDARLESFKFGVMELYEDLDLDKEIDLPAEVVAQYLYDQLLVLGGAIETADQIRRQADFGQARGGMKL
jgi:hypothetical protein